MHDRTILEKKKKKKKEKKEKKDVSGAEELPYNIVPIHDSWENFDNGSYKIEQLLVVESAGVRFILRTHASTCRTPSLVCLCFDFSHRLSHREQSLSVLR